MFFRSIVLLASSAAFVSSAQAALVATDTRVMFDRGPESDGRLFIDGVTSTWDNSKSWPGFSPDTDPARYDLVPIAFAPNAAQDIYYEISWRNFDFLNPHAVAYLDSFDPADPSQNYLGDFGLTPSGGFGFETFQVVVPAGRSLVLSFVRRNNHQLPAGYEYRVEAFSDALRNEEFVTAVPEPASWALMVGGFAMVGGALRRRPAAQPAVSPTPFHAQKQ